MKIIEAEKVAYLFSSASLIQILESITSIKTKVAIIESLGPRLTDPKAKTAQILNMFRYAEERARVEKVLRTRSNSLSHSIFRSTSGANLSLHASREISSDNSEVSTRPRARTNTITSGSPEVGVGVNLGSGLGGRGRGGIGRRKSTATFDANTSPLRSSRSGLVKLDASFTGSHLSSGTDYSSNDQVQVLPTIDDLRAFTELELVIAEPINPVPQVSDANDGTQSKRSSNRLSLRRRNQVGTGDSTFSIEALRKALEDDSPVVTPNAQNIAQSYNTIAHVNNSLNKDTSELTTTKEFPINDLKVLEVESTNKEPAFVISSDTKAELKVQQEIPLTSVKSSSSSGSNTATIKPSPVKFPFGSRSPPNTSHKPVVPSYEVTNPIWRMPELKSESVVNETIESSPIKSEGETLPSTRSKVAEAIARTEKAIAEQKKATLSPERKNTTLSPECKNEILSPEPKSVESEKKNVTTFSRNPFLRSSLTNRSSGSNPSSTPVNSPALKHTKTVVPTARTNSDANPVSETVYPEPESTNEIEKTAPTAPLVGSPIEKDAATRMLEWRKHELRMEQEAEAQRRSLELKQEKERQQAQEIDDSSQRHSSRVRSGASELSFGLTAVAEETAEEEEENEDDEDYEEKNKERSSEEDIGEGEHKDERKVENARHLEDATPTRQPKSTSPISVSPSAASNISSNNTAGKESGLKLTTTSSGRQVYTGSAEDNEKPNESLRAPLLIEDKNRSINTDAKHEKSTRNAFPWCCTIS
jgi:hypothetical protein